MIECKVKGCKEESVCNHCWKCQKHHDEELGLDTKDKLPRSPGVFIERAALCSIEGIRAICGTDKEYSDYVKKIVSSKNKKTRLENE